MGVSVGFGLGPVRVSKRLGRGGHRRRSSSRGNVVDAVGGIDDLVQAAARRKVEKRASEIHAEWEQERPAFDTAQDVAKEAHRAAYAVEFDRTRDYDAASTAGRAAHRVAFYEASRDLKGFTIDPEIEAYIAERDGMLVSASAWRDMAEQGIVAPPEASSPPAQPLTLRNNETLNRLSDRLDERLEHRKARTTQLRAQIAEQNEAIRRRGGRRP